MTAEKTLKYWRDNLSCEEQVKMQLLDEYANADTPEEILKLKEISRLLEKEKITSSKHTKK